MEDQSEYKKKPETQKEKVFEFTHFLAPNVEKSQFIYESNLEQKHIDYLTGLLIKTFNESPKRSQQSFLKSFSEPVVESDYLTKIASEFPVTVREMGNSWLSIFSEWKNLPNPKPVLWTWVTDSFYAPEKKLK